jgi:hypothetical protein
MKQESSLLRVVPQKLYKFRLANVIEFRRGPHGVDVGLDVFIDLTDDLQFVFNTVRDIYAIQQRLYRHRHFLKSDFGGLASGKVRNTLWRWRRFGLVRGALIRSVFAVVVFTDVKVLDKLVADGAKGTHDSIACVSVLLIDGCEYLVIFWTLFL